MSYDTSTPDDVESQIPEDQGGMWFLKDALDTDRLGFTILELDPGAANMEHSHDEQEEIYYVERGAVNVQLEDEVVSLAEGEAIRIDPDETRQIVNQDSQSRLILVGAPRDE